MLLKATSKHQVIAGYTNAEGGYQSKPSKIMTHTSYFFSTGEAGSGTFPSFGSGRWLTLGISETAAAGSASLLSLMMSGSVGCSFDEPTGLRFGLSPKIESASSFSLMKDAALTRDDSPSSVARRSFSRRVSRPRLWQYQKTKRRTMLRQYERG
jgi:hypothetical protein